MNRVVQMITNSHDHKVNWTGKPRACKYKMYASNMFVADECKSKQDNDSVWP